MRTQTPNMNKQTKYTAGIDAGSTTVKIAILNSENQLIFSSYRRHQTKIQETVLETLQEAKQKLGNIELNIICTGSAGMGLSERTGAPFIQEVVASTEVVIKRFPTVRTLIDIGGEDSKMIFFNEEKSPDIRMNGSCAGGTGAFIDQIASLLNLPAIELDKLANEYTKIYPIASRCGVFAKTDVQNLLSRKIPHSDICASVFHAMAVQTLNTLSRGYDIVNDVMFTGGPFSFLPNLTKQFHKKLNIKSENIITPERPELITAEGAALSNQNSKISKHLSEWIQVFENAVSNKPSKSHRLEPLFDNDLQREKWLEKRITANIEILPLNEYKQNVCYLGIDSGSTTTKIVITGEANELLFKYYKHNFGNPAFTVTEGLKEFRQLLTDTGRLESMVIANTAVTGYGEELIKAAFGLDLGIVETIAHYSAAKHFNPQVSFILDIGGQDMKSMFVQNGIVHRIELNESCSAGCGSFIETFAKSLGYEAEEFGKKACFASNPADLGTRCTVFMNSKVKQSLRENASVEDIASGLSISIIKNALYKVLKLKDSKELGEHIVIQGGTFKNPSVHRALELLTDRKVICTNIPELMGAYGASLYAKEKFKINPATSTFIGINDIEKSQNFDVKQLVCKGCENLCTVAKFNFGTDQNFFSGNKCEKVFNNKGETEYTGFNMYAWKYDQLFLRQSFQNIAAKQLRIGMPRVMNMYENYPFWHTLFVHCGFDVVLSSPSTVTLSESGAGTVMSDSICFPAKLIHGHIPDLVSKKVDRIFHPMEVFEKQEFKLAENSYNCPIVSGYPDVIRSAINPERKYGIPYDTPTIHFNDNQLLYKSCKEYLVKLKVNKNVIKIAFKFALAEQAKYKISLREKGKEIAEKAKNTGRMLIVLCGRPYQADPLVNHKTPNILAEMGVDVLSEDSVPEIYDMSGIRVLSQWAYPNRLYNAAQWVANQDNMVQMVQFNSFGCGPDAITVDESSELLRSKGKNLTIIKIDDINSTGSVRLRLRSMIESAKIKNQSTFVGDYIRKETAIFDKKSAHKTILAPSFGEMYSPYLKPLFAAAGYKMELLPPPDKESVNNGLKYINNEICYPATVTIGDVIKGLKSGKYNRNEVAVCVSQTGGQCRASTYLSLLKKALISSGFEDIPVVSFSAGGYSTQHPQPGFKINWKTIISIALATVIYSDVLAKMYYGCVVREKIKGLSWNTLVKYQNAAAPYIEKKDSKSLYKLMKIAVKEFNSIDVINNNPPKVGIVGEIFVKYNYFGHGHIIDWLISQGIEPVVPPLIEFFTQEFINLEHNNKAKIRNKKFSDFIVKGLEYYSDWYIYKANKIMQKFKFFDPFVSTRYLATKASNVVSLVNQFGEGWLIPGQISMFAEQNINHVISVQPFGCIANHIVSKGIEKRIRDLYPKMNLLFLDFDDGTTEVNILNRLHFLIKSMKDSIKNLITIEK